jgi:hypothetical protein
VPLLAPQREAGFEAGGGLGVLAMVQGDDAEVVVEAGDAVAIVQRLVKGEPLLEESDRRFVLPLAPGEHAGALEDLREGPAPALGAGDLGRRIDADDLLEPAAALGE